MNFAKNETETYISEELYWTIIAACPKAGTILELGSGETTAEFAKFRNIVSIEDDPMWLGKYNKQENYIYVPNSAPGYFYDAEVLKRILPEVKYDVLFIDGTDKDNRIDEFMKVMHLFNPNVPWFFDDWAYHAFQSGFKKLTQCLGRGIVVFTRTLKQWAVAI
jgi:hypothetical protein